MSFIKICNSSIMFISTISLSRFCEKNCIPYICSLFALYDKNHKIEFCFGSRNEFQDMVVPYTFTVKYNTVLYKFLHWEPLETHLEQVMPHSHLLVLRPQQGSSHIFHSLRPLHITCQDSFILPDGRKPVIFCSCLCHSCSSLCWMLFSFSSAELSTYLLTL